MARSTRDRRRTGYRRAVHETVAVFAGSLSEVAVRLTFARPDVPRTLTGTCTDSPNPAASSALGTFADQPAARSEGA